MWRWAEDNWNSYERTSLPGPLKHTFLQYDKLQHLLTGILTTLTTVACVKVFGFSVHVSLVMLINLLVWTLWEVKDALIPWEKKYIFIINCGGDGFSWKDMLCSYFGVVLVSALFAVVL